MTFPGVAVDLGHLGLELRVKPEHVVVDQELAVRVRPRSEADDEAVLRPLGDQLADPVRHHFEQDRVRSGFLERFGVVHDLLRLSGAFALDAEAAQGAGRSAASIRGVP